MWLIGFRSSSSIAAACRPGRPRFRSAQHPELSTGFFPRAFSRPHRERISNSCHSRSGAQSPTRNPRFPQESWLSGAPILPGTPATHKWRTTRCAHLRCSRNWTSEAAAGRSGGRCPGRVRPNEGRRGSSRRLRRLRHRPDRVQPAGPTASDESRPSCRSSRRRRNEARGNS